MQSFVTSGSKDQQLHIAQVRVLDGFDSLKNSTERLNSHDNDSDNNQFNIGKFSQSYDKRKVHVIDKIAEEVEHKYLTQERGIEKT